MMWALFTVAPALGLRVWAYQHIATKCAHIGMISKYEELFVLAPAPARACERGGFRSPWQNPIVALSLATIGVGLERYPRL